MTDIIIIVLLSILTVLCIGILIMILIGKNKPQEIGSIDKYIEIVQGLLEQMKDHQENIRRMYSQHLEQEVRTINNNLSELSKVERENANSLREQILKQISQVRETVYKSLSDIKEDNNKQLNNMRQIIDKTLVDTLEHRLNKSYGIISERLEAVAKGFGEMQKLASGVSDLKSVLSNVKTRGLWGEVMLGNLLEQMLTPEQFKEQYSIDGSEKVDFAVILPGKNNDTVVLPIDSKFPDSSYQDLLDAGDDKIKCEQAVKCLVNELKKQGKSISEKYIKPPLTTDFAIMYLPTEGLFSEAVKRTGLLEELQNKHRIIIAGPTTLAALLSSLRMGFKTLAIEKRSIEIRDMLITFKTEFGKFASILDTTQNRLSKVTKSLDDATKKTRTISRKLSAVEYITDTSEEDLIGEE